MAKSTRSKTISQCLLEVRQRDPKLTAYMTKEKREWVRYSWQEFFEQCQNVGVALAQMGIEKGDRIAIMSNTRSEWTLLDFGALGIRGVVVPIYQNSNTEDLQYILQDSEPKVLVIESLDLFDRWRQVKDQCPSVKQIVVLVHTTELPPGVISFSELKDRGEKHHSENPQMFESLCNECHLDDRASIIYTSGTTGSPKGVVLNHRQIISEMEDTFHLANVNEDDVTLSFLPYAHVFGRLESWGMVYAGFTVAFAESIEKVRKNLKEVRPTFFMAVPRIFEKIYNNILTQVESSMTKRKLFAWALGVGKQVSECRLKRKSLPLILLPQYTLAKRLIFNPLKENLGGRLKFAISGGAPLEKKIAAFFHAADVLILEGYGLTETTAAITLNTPYDYQFGTVGKPLEDVNIKLAEDGEILVKSDKVMAGYYNQPELTKSVIDDQGFFATGDIGEFTPEGFLKITDRKKDLIKTAGGKYVAPQRLEGLLKLHHMVSNVLIHGDREKYIVALITLDEEATLEFAKEKGLKFNNLTELSQSPEVKKEIHKAVTEANAQLASFESIKTFDVLPKDFTVETGELTPSLKVKRKFCDEKYRDRIRSLYTSPSL